MKVGDRFEMTGTLVKIDERGLAHIEIDGYPIKGAHHVYWAKDLEKMAKPIGEERKEGDQ